MNNNDSFVKNNINIVRKNIEIACKNCGRDVNEITLIAVSKTKPNDAIEDAVKEGIYRFGENKVQELTKKMEFFSDKNLEWHMIGHLQKNKVKYIIGKVKMIHSCDTYELAQIIDKESEKNRVVTEILLEVNIANEDTKFGFNKYEIMNGIDKLSTLEHIRIRGLMTVAPYVENPELNRDFFKQLKQLSVDINSKNIDNIRIDCLSMGMTNDYMIAIEEGATHVRVGTGIFGERDYNIERQGRCYE